MAYRTNDARSITAAGFTRLLGRLHPDLERAGEEYERLRRALVKFFDWRGAPEPDSCADEALDRLAKKLDETDVEDVRNYAHGIARHILLERRRDPSFSSIEGHPHLPAVVTPEDEDAQLHHCFDRCLAEIPEDGRSLVVRYYEGERSTKISNRRSMAAALGLSEGALRSRVQRLRDRLEQCVQSCVAVER
jgi:DNA-directed RNA polymerase specialized sigma24 family protein